MWNLHDMGPFNLSDLKPSSRTPNQKLCIEYPFREFASKDSPFVYLYAYAPDWGSTLACDFEQSVASRLTQLPPAEASTVLSLPCLSGRTDKPDWVCGTRSAVAAWPLIWWYITNLSILSMSFFIGGRAVEGKSKASHQPVCYHQQCTDLKRKAARSVTHSWCRRLLYRSINRDICYSQSQLSFGPLTHRVYYVVNWGIPSKSF